MLRLPAIIGIWAASLALTAYFVHDYTVALADQRELEAVRAAIIKHDVAYKEVARIENNQQSKLEDVNTVLNARLDRLRNRSRVPEATTTEQPCGDRPELPRTIEADLERLAADAERIQIGLSACYEYADSLQK